MENLIKSGKDIPFISVQHVLQINKTKKLFCYIHLLKRLNKDKKL